MSVIKDIRELEASGYDESSIEKAIQWNKKWEAFLASPMGPFLSYGDPEELWEQTNLLIDLNTLAQNVEELAPDAILFAFGILPIWRSIGGNVIGYHPDKQTFFWAYHDCIFCDEYLLLPKTYEQLPLNDENLMKALISFSEEECGTFLRNLRDGVYDKTINKLDGIQ